MVQAFGLRRGPVHAANTARKHFDARRRSSPKIKWKNFLFSGIFKISASAVA
jgi:hypothetical protein